ncbi:MAG TPA: hypothetical protein VIL74_03865 [Pyrinomonadaceae bacterium]|jgi:hypothetical protein
MTKIAFILLSCSVPLVILAFYPLYLSKPFAGVDRYTHFHAFTGALWLLLLILQPLFVYAHRYRLHLILGRLSYLLAPLFVLASILLSHYRLVSMNDATFAQEGYSHYLPFYAVVVFSAAYLLGLRYRHAFEAHGRFMLCTGLPLIDPVIGRVIFFYFPALPSPWFYQAVTFSLATLASGLLVFSYRGELSARRALIAYFALLVVLEVGWFTFALSSAWLFIVGWFRGLPLTS